MDKRESVNKISFFLILFAVIGVSVSSRNFAKLHVGPFYMLDLIFFIWLLFAVLSGQGRDITKSLKILIVPALFFSWGMVWLVCDVYKAISNVDPISMARIAQHTIVYLYPLFWMTVGVWCFRHFPSHYKWIVLSCLLTVWPNCFGQNVANISLGPVSVIPWVFSLNLFLYESNSRLLRVQTFIWSILACLPLWLMWLTSVQRTTALIFILLLLLVPIALYKSRKINRHPLKLMMCAFGIYLFGQIIILGSASIIDWTRTEHSHSVSAVAPLSLSATSPLSNAASASEESKTLNRLYMAVEHGDDRPSNGNAEPFQMRTRRFMWRRTLEDWRRRPIIGIGSIPEVPSQIRPGLANTYDGQVRNTPPIAGPHNSYLSILARMGVIGTIIFVALIVQGIGKAMELIKLPNLTLTDLLVVFVPLNGLIYALFNSGFESPHNCFMLWLFSGILFAKTTESAANIKTVQ